MKKLHLFIALFCIAFFANATTLKVKLTTVEKTPKANYAMGIAKYAFDYEYWKECDTMLISDNGNFEIDLDSGMYILLLNHPYCQEYYYQYRGKYLL